MALPARHEPHRCANEIKEQLMSSQRKTGFFFGAGTSMAAGLPGIIALTNDVEAKLGPDELKTWKAVRSTLPAGHHLEHILNRIRLLRELLGDSTKRSADGVDGASAKQLDAAICNAVYWRLSDMTKSDLSHHLAFASWIRQVQWTYPVEVFTTNYDWILERAFEQLQIPYFDGFVGRVRPFFAPQCVEADGSKSSSGDYPPTSWIRLWKLHGSIGWREELDPSGTGNRLVRIANEPPEPGTELLIYPSREKYTDSRKLPYLSYIDRLGKFLITSPSLLVICGYSFGDEHLNSVLIQGLRTNNRAAILALSFDPLADTVLRIAENLRNFAAFGPDTACIGGLSGSWIPPSSAKSTTDECLYWDEKKNSFLLGSFSAFARLLQLMVPQPAVAAAKVGVPTS